MNYNGSTVPSGGLSPAIAKSVSLAEQSHIVMLQNEVALKFLNQIMARLDSVGIKENPDDGSRPSMNILQQLECATQIAARTNELLGQLERKLFG